MQLLHPPFGGLAQIRLRGGALAVAVAQEEIEACLLPIVMPGEAGANRVEEYVPVARRAGGAADGFQKPAGAAVQLRGKAIGEGSQRRRSPACADAELVDVLDVFVGTLDR